MTLHYLFGGEEVYSSEVNIPVGESFTLSEEDFTILGGAYIVTGLDSDTSSISSLTESIVLDEAHDGSCAYLLCQRPQTFTMSTAIENVCDSEGTAYTRSTATIYNGTDTGKTATVIVAKYTDDGILAGVERETIILEPASESAVTKTVNTPVGEGFTAIMLWNDFSGLMPYLSKVDSRNPSGESKRPETDDLIMIPTTNKYVTPSSEQSGNEAVNMLTRDGGTRWSAQAAENEPVYADIDLGLTHDIHTVGLAFYNGKVRSSRFSVAISTDGESWHEVVAPRYSSGKTAAVEYYSFDTAPARYVRLYGYGWKANEITNEGLVEKSDYWFSVTAFEAYGTVSGDEIIVESENQSFDSAVSLIGAGWETAALNEMTYTDYTPTTGTELHGEIAQTPAESGMGESNKAMHLYDNVDRDDSGSGAGAIGASHKLSIPSDKYTVSFKWYVPNTIDEKTYNAQWAGVTLSSGKISGGADTSHPAALQLRLAPSGKNKMAFNIMRSITYNEGDQVGLLGSSYAFKAGCVWDVRLDVNSLADTVLVTVSDGTRTESQLVRYGLFNAERTINQTWSSSKVNYIMFNTGAGGKCEMYIDDFSVTETPDDSENEGNIVFEQNFSSFEAKTDIRTEQGGVSSALIKETDQAYTGYYGTMLGVNIDTNNKLDGNTLHLYDYVGRDGNSTKGSGGVFAYVDLPKLSESSITKIKFDMIAPTYGEWAGFALGSGHNEGGDDTTHPLALQVRFSPQSEGMQFNRNNGTYYNKGSNSAFVGTGNNRLGYNKVWSFEISFNPLLKNMTVKATDGSIVSTGTASVPDGWGSNRIDTLIFNTGSGTSTNMYVDNIQVIDTGLEKTSLAAVNGIIRLESVYSGEGYYLYHNNSSGSSLSVGKNKNPFYTRVVERKGLADPDSVSFELMSNPGYYLVADSSWKVSIQKYRDTDEFRRDATFNKVSSLLGRDSKNDFSYQLYRNNKLYLRENGSSITVYQYKSDDGDGIKKACSFHLRSEASSYVSDSFDGTSISSQWQKGYPWYTNYHNHSAVHRDSNVVVSGGRVLLKATKRGDNEWIKNSAGQTGYSDSINNNTWKRYVAWTGVISINKKVFNKGSYIEGSFKQPNSPRGYWTAFWLNGRDSWPPETDMFEYLSSKGTSTWYTATHGGTEGAGWQTNSAVGNLRTQYHTFAIDWGYNYMKMYVNGSLYFEAPDTSYQKNMYLILNTGIGAWESEPDSTTKWGEGLECKWIRGFQYY